jgi:hypothetical protein
MSDTVGELVVKVTADTKEMTNAIQGDAEKAGKSFAQKMGAGMKGLAVAGVAAGAAAATGLAIVGKQAIETASDLNETATKVDQLFGEEGSAQIKEWSQTTAETMGQSALAAQNAAADFAIFGKVAGLAGQDLVDFSKDNTRLASDLASFFNTEPAEAAQAIASALRGESEPMRKYGVIINDAALKQAYFEETGEKVTGTLTGQQKALAANRVIWDQTKDAQDDFARTSDGLANSQRTLAATLEDVKSVVGQGLLPAVTTIVQAIGPLAKDLQEPLAEIASVIGEQLASAFETLSPLLGPLAEALTSLGGSVLKAVISAVKALVPAITPLLSIFAEVGERLGPLLERILGKVAEVLVELFGAATPVIDVLFDLAFEILDALWPIIEVVVDTLIDMIKAFTPLLRAVTMLLPPFTMLINTVFKVIMPILKPLMPVFVAFAEIMGDVMVRAVGGLMLAFGKFLSVMGDISPFIRDKVVKPTISFITVWAAKMVEGAVVAFGWVPGLDKKLEGAAKAVENFGKDAEDAIHQAFVETAADAKAMGQEMADIGQDLVDNGAASNAYEAGREIGKGVALGMEAGIKNNSIQAQVAALNMVKGVEYDSKNYLQQNSPSKRFITIGEGVVEGFVKGLEKGGVSEAMVKTLTDGTEAALDSLQSLLNEAKRMLDKSEQDYRQYALNVKAALIGDAANPAIAMEKTQMQAQNLADAQERLNELRAQAANGRKISDEQFAEAEADVRAAEAAAKSFEENFQAGIDLSSAFANALNEAAPVIAAQFDLTTPEGRRMYDTMIQNIAAAGPEVGLATAQAISAGLLSPEAFNDLKTLDALAGDVGVAVFATSKAEGRKYGEEMIKGIKAQIKASEKQLKKIGRDAGKGMVDGLRSTIKDWTQVIQDYVKGTKVTLQISSPSKVFEKIGEQTGQGFTNGFAKTADSPINPPGGMRTRAYSPDAGSLSGGDTNVKVFIGDRELTDIVDVQVEKNQDNMARSLMLGRY